MKKFIKVVLVLVIIGGCLFGGYKYYKNNKNNKPLVENKPVSIGKIEGYDYELEDRDTKLYKDNYNELKKVLEGETIDYKKYAELISKLYIIDLYTIDNKITLYDVGGSEFVLKSARDNYELKVKDTLYKYVEDNSYNTRKQELPVVKSIEVKNITEKKYKVDDKELDGYQVELAWEYNKDLGYDKSAILSVVRVEKVLYVIEQSKKEVQE